MRTSSLTLLLMLVLGGCALDGGAEPGGDELAGKADGWGDSDGARIVFGQDWSETVTGTVRAGGALQVRYDADRLPDCRGEMGGMAQWGISASASVDGADAEVIALMPGEDGLLEGIFAAIPAGADLSIWFTVANRWGCVGYDSEYGGNYHFPIAPAPAPGTVTLRFDADWHVELSGPIHAGDELTVSYDLARLPDCRGTMYGRPAWSIGGWYSIDGGEPHPFEVSRIEGSERVAQDAVITVPGGDEIALWFEITNRWGCHGYDSNYGANWTFPISP